MGRPASPRTRTNQWERGQRSGVFCRAAGRAARPGLRVCRPWSAPGPCAAGRIPAPWTPGRAAQPATVGTGPSPVHAGGEAGGGSGLCQQPGKDAPAPRSPPPHPRPRAGCAPRGFGHAPLTSDDSSGPRPGDQSALSGTAECGAGRPQPPRACGLGGSAPSQLSGHTAQPPTNPSQNEATWRQRPRAGGRLCVRQAEARTARPPGAVGCWLGKVLSVPHTYGQGDRPAPSELTMVTGHRAKERPPRPTKDMQTSLERCWEKRGCHCGGPWVSPRPAGRSRPPSPPPCRPAGGVILASSDACVGLVFNHEEQSLR